MRLTLRSLRLLISEAIDTSRLVIDSSGNADTHTFLLFDMDRLEFGGTTEDALMGGIIISRYFSGWAVDSISAKHGYGPLLYKLAMKFAGDAGLRKNRGGNTSPAAQAVWNRFENDPAVKKRYDTDLGMNFMVRTGTDIPRLQKAKVTSGQREIAKGLVRFLWTSDDE